MILYSFLILHFPSSSYSDVVIVSQFNTILNGQRPLYTVSNSMTKRNKFKSGFYPSGI